MTGRVYTAIGLMSGTSLDGIDAALIRTDGHEIVERLEFVSLPFDPEMQETLRACLGKKDDEDGFVTRTEIALTRAHAAAIDWLLAKSGRQPKEIDLVGFHGQTLYHDPDNRFTWQIGNGAMLARLSGIDVINDFRSEDVKAGGQGAPLLPLYHRALLRQAKHELPVAVLNIGGVSNVTWLGEAKENDAEEVIAFDTGPGNALLNDWIQAHLKRPYDENGMTARQGQIKDALISQWLSDPYFSQKPPKSLDRDAWSCVGMGKLSVADGAATLTAFTAHAVAKAQAYFPQLPKAWYVTGGGRHNPVLMAALADMLPVPVKAVEELGWDGDAIEAEGFAYLAVRSVKNLPLSLPGTTGVPAPQTGGRLFKSKDNKGAAAE